MLDGDYSINTEMKMFLQGEWFATATYSLCFGKTPSTNVEFSPSASEEQRSRITALLNRPTIFFINNKYMESIGMRTYKPGTLSHFVSIVPKIRALGYTVELDETAAEVYQEISADF